MNIELSKKKMEELLITFQCAILDLTAKLAEGGAVISLEDVEDAHYVVGMATITSANLEMLLSQDKAHFVEKESSILQFLADASQFADKLHAEGYGFPV
jgi:hypothetical protein